MNGPEGCYRFEAKPSAPGAQVFQDQGSLPAFDLSCYTVRNLVLQGKRVP